MYLYYYLPEIVLEQKVATCQKMSWDKRVQLPEIVLEQNVNTCQKIQLQEIVLVATCHNTSYQLYFREKVTLARTVQ